MAKTLHWTQRPGGKEKLSRAIRKGYRAKRNGKAHVSKAERIIEGKVGKANASRMRDTLYRRAVDTAAASRELHRLGQMLAYSALHALGDRA